MEGVGNVRKKKRKGDLRKGKEREAAGKRWKRIERTRWARKGRERIKGDEVDVLKRKRTKKKKAPLRGAKQRVRIKGLMNNAQWPMKVQKRRGLHPLAPVAC